MKVEPAQIISNEIGQQYYSGSTEIQAGNHTMYVNKVDLQVLVYKGKSKKPLYNFIFESLVDLKDWTSNKKNIFNSEYSEKQKAKEFKLNLIHSLNVGDVLVCDSHSHLIRFFQVTKIADPKKVHVREINQLQISDTAYGGYCAPLKDSFKSVEFKVQVCGEDNLMKFTNYLFMKKLRTDISAKLVKYARLLNTSFEPVSFQLNG